MAKFNIMSFNRARTYSPPSGPIGIPSIGKSHKKSRMLLKDRVLPVDNNTVFLAHYDITENEVLTGMVPISNVSTLRRYEGKFGGGVAVEEGTTNYVVSPDISFELVSPLSGNGYAQPTRSHTHPFGGTTGNTIDKIYSISFEVQQRSEYPFNSVVVGGDEIGDSWSIRLYPNGAIGGGSNVEPLMFEKISLYDKWDRYEYSFNILGSGTGYLQSYIKFIAENELNGTLVDSSINNVQLEEKPFPTSFINGTRIKGELRYSDSLLDHREGTLSFWYKPTIPWSNTSMDNGTIEPYNEDLFTWGVPGEANCLWGRRQRALKEINFYYNNNAAGNVCSFDYAGILVDKETVMITYTWKDGEQKLYVDGIMRASKTATYMERPTVGDFKVGYRQSFPTCNGVIDELRIDNIARTDEEIYQWYISNSPFYPKGVYRIAY